MTLLLTITRILAVPFAVLAPMDAAVAGAAGMANEAVFWLVVAIVATAALIWSSHVLRRQEAERREAMRAYREQWFASFERRRRMRDGLR